VERLFDAMILMGQRWKRTSDVVAGGKDGGGGGGRGGHGVDGDDVADVDECFGDSVV